jgi:4-diphosphocytidyl-2C-methyl-D-erythritol kinase
MPLRFEEKSTDGDKSKMILRKAFHLDQRGSVNTEMRQRRLQSRLLINNRGSVASCSAYSRAKSEFSFHPSINYDSKWKPKYDDHHDHNKMWNRMHAENEKINRKKRLMSEQKSVEEMSGCTFTPELVTK